MGESLCQHRDASRLIDIHHKPALDVAQGTAANILINRQMKHAVNQPFAQRAASESHALNVHFGENGDQNGEAAGENQRALEGQPFDLQLFKPTALDRALLKLLEFAKGNALIHALRHHNLLQRLHGAGRADTHFPAVATKLIRDRTQHFARRLLCGVEILLRQMTIGEIALEPGNAAHRQAEQRSGLCPGAGHEFRACATNIDHQALIRAAGGMGNALVNQAGFFLAADHLYRTAEDLLRFVEKLMCIDGQTQRGGRHHADLLLRDILQAFGKEAQTLPAALHRLLREAIVLAQARRKADFAFNTRQSLDTASHLAHNQHMKTVGTEINSCVERGGTEHSN